jgi:hypothetical protein
MILRWTGLFHFLRWIMSVDRSRPYSAGDVVNQIKREYNAFGLLSTEYQEHGGAVNTSTSRKVAYALNPRD